MNTMTQLVVYFPEFVVVENCAFAASIAVMLTLEAFDCMSQNMSVNFASFKIILA